MSVLKVGIIGVGGIARTHIPGWEASTDAELVAGCDVREAELLRWGETQGIDRLTTDASELFSDSDIQIIDICTPNAYHAPLAIAGVGRRENTSSARSRLLQGPRTFGL